MRLVALQDGVHTVAVRVSGLVKNEKYRITAWVRPQAGANFGIAGRDQADKDNGPNNSRAIFDLYNQNVLPVSGNGKPCAVPRAPGRICLVSSLKPANTRQTYLPL